MRRLEIMSDDVPVATVEDFGYVDLQERLKAFCKEQGLEMPRFWVFPPNGVMTVYALTMHLNGNDRWEEFEANAFFLLKTLHEIGDYEALENRLLAIFSDLGEPIVLTVRADNANCQQSFFKGVGMMKMPVTWQDDSGNIYEVYVKGEFGMGGFVNLMERVEYIGKEIVYRESNGT